YFADEQKAIDEAAAALEAANDALAELEEEHGGEDAVFGALDKINTAAVRERICEIGNDKDATDELAVLKRGQKLSDQESAAKKRFKELETALDKAAYEKYPKLSMDEIKALVVQDKWLACLAADMQGEMERVSQTLTGRVRELANRYESPLPVLVDEIA